MQLLITRDGVARPTGEYELHQYFGFRGTNAELVGYAVRDLGAALVSQGPLGCRVLFRPGLVSSQARARLVELLLTWDPSRVALESIAGGPAEVSGNLLDVLARLDDLLAPERPDSRGSLYQTVPLSLDRLAETGAPHLSAAYRTWRRRRGALGRAELRRVLKNPIGGKTHWARMSSEDGPLTEIIPDYAEYWGQTDPDLTSLLGAPMSSHPDRRYGIDTSAGYLLADHHDEPRLELVEASVRLPGCAPVKTRYVRLLMPWSSPDGTRYISSVSRARLVRWPASTDPIQAPARFETVQR
jgi:hypothetical protein